MSHSEDAQKATTPSARPARNRVTPMGEIAAIPLRGAWTGNRGILHSGREIVRFHASDLWITPSTVAALQAGYLPQIDEPALD